MAVLAQMILALVMVRGQPTLIDFSRMKPSDRNESLMDPPGFFMIWM